MSRAHDPVRGARSLETPHATFDHGRELAGIHRCDSRLVRARHRREGRVDSDPPCLQTRCHPYPSGHRSSRRLAIRWTRSTVGPRICLSRRSVPVGPMRQIHAGRCSLPARKHLHHLVIRNASCVRCSAALALCTPRKPGRHILHLDRAGSLQSGTTRASKLSPELGSEAGQLSIRSRDRSAFGWIERSPTIDCLGNGGRWGVGGRI